ncbi:glycine cleavage system aminomethyltransferase GcvT [Leucobacter luti]|uniref:Aminomethyltransferase n=1 Tax=Leucobacter luti TaxID=340320 RepID=A0A4Q7U4L4_9MICO|nr:glycine cleavage system aminomethyltransferase GcvT [Leucobacter luti]MBL3700525.1 glycine cleavage system aminomethyltransferase GcvT [Leucobacter luti]RZT68641.1 aminomethyltransferase [Leucobacter luti]
MTTTAAQAAPAQTALYPEHAALGASFTDFGGWDMPLKYGSELAEHRAVRAAAGLFDLSHMGEIRVTGPDAGKFLNTALVGNLAVVAVGRAKYSLMCDAAGGIIDDLISYRLGDEEFLVVPNAGNAPMVAAEFAARAEGFDVTVADESAATSLIAVQGPAAAQILLALVPAEQHALVSELRYYAAAPATVAGLDVLLARTGYTGEDGFELYLPNARAAELWRALLAAGEPLGLIPAGLAARDSLRLEAGMPLYGNELGRDVTPFAAGLGPVVSFKKDERFIGRDALEALREAGPTRVLVGLRGSGRRAGRAGYPVLADGVQIGEVTSGQPSPTLGYPIALASVDPAYAAVGTELAVDLRGKPEPFTVVELPFYSRPQ